METQKKKKSKWGLGIALLYSAFVLFILSVVIFSVSQDFTMVEDNYYQKSLTYQEKIDQMQNSENLPDKPFIELNKDENKLTITFPDSLAESGISGTAHFFRPSDKHADQLLPIELSEMHVMEISTNRFLKGSWVLKLSWESSGILFYQEENLTI